MEVHHGSHVHHTKKWKDYLFEFLMLFLAVSAGFFVENQREHYVERHRENQYMQSMVEDLKSDSSAFSENMSLREMRAIYLDSLVWLLHTGKFREQGSDVYYYGRTISIPANYFPNDRTIQQLKSSGNLRLIRNMEVSNLIMSYDKEMRSGLHDLEDEMILRNEYRPLARKIFDGNSFSGMVRENEIRRPEGNPQLFSTDPALINELTGEAQYLRKANQNQIMRARQMMKHAIELIHVIQKEYPGD